MFNSLSAGLNQGPAVLLAIFYNIFSPQQLTHCLSGGHYCDARVDGCCDRSKYVSAGLGLLFDIEVT